MTSWISWLPFATCLLALTACNSESETRAPHSDAGLSPSDRSDAEAAHPTGNPTDDGGDDGGETSAPDASPASGLGDAGSGQDASTAPDASERAVECNVVVTGDVEFEGTCDVFICRPAGGNESLSVIRWWGPTNQNLVNVIGEIDGAFATGTYDENDLSNGGRVDIRQDGVNYVAEPGTLAIEIKALFDSPDPDNVCGATFSGSVSGDAVEQDPDGGTPRAAHFEFTLQ